jgi:hypothetical protein
MAEYIQVPDSQSGSNDTLAVNGTVDASHTLSSNMQPITISHARQVAFPVGLEER